MTTSAIDFDAVSLAETQFSFALGVAVTLHKPDLLMPYQQLCWLS